MIDRILLADDDALTREWMSEVLSRKGRLVDVVTDGRAAIEALRSRGYDLVITDVRMPYADGLEVTREAKKSGADAIVMTAYGAIETAVGAMRDGAFDFLIKPVAPEILEASLVRLEATRTLRTENAVLKARVEVATASSDAALVGDAPSIKAAIDLAVRVASTPATVLVRGESGTGKELIAALIHARSPRSAAPFIKLNCAALSESLLCSELFGHERGAFTGATMRRAGRFELADGGTLFLDEIGEVAQDVQAKLLRVLESGEFERVGGTTTLKVDVRVVAATNRDLESAIAFGSFRKDLFHRLNVLPISLPPLRARRSDIRMLANHFLAKHRPTLGGTAKSISQDALVALESYEWPGNVRELSNVIARGLLSASGESITSEDLALGATNQSHVASPQPKSCRTGSLEEIEREVIIETLAATHGNRSEAARRLGITARTLFNKVRTYREQGHLSEMGA